MTASLVDPWPLVDTDLVSDKARDAAAAGNLGTLTMSEHAYVESLALPLLPAEQVLAAPEHRPASTLPRGLRRAATRLGVAQSDDVARMRRIATRLRAAGLRVEFVDGWERRGRPGTFDPRNVVEHHDASPIVTGLGGYLWAIVHGRSDLSGPLAQFQVGRDGTWYIVAAGRANHAGVGGGLLGIPWNSGNAYCYGVEVANDGRGEQYSDALMASLDVGLGCVLAEVERPAGNLIGHKEYARGRKIDPLIDMTARRQRVAHCMTGAPPATVDRLLRLTDPLMHGLDVVNVQVALVAAKVHVPGGADGWYGTATAAAVSTFQRAYGLAVDGIVGPRTWAALRAAARIPVPPPAPPVPPAPPTPEPPAPEPPAPKPATPVYTRVLRVTSPPMNGHEVFYAQQALVLCRLLPEQDRDGVYGPQTERAMRAFQRSRRLTPDGIVGPKTWAALRMVVSPR